jgi:hypothetical protein
LLVCGSAQRSIGSTAATSLFSNLSRNLIIQGKQRIISFPEHSVWTNILHFSRYWVLLFINFLHSTYLSCASYVYTVFFYTTLCIFISGADERFKWTNVCSDEPYQVWAYILHHRSNLCPDGLILLINDVLGESVPDTARLAGKSWINVYQHTHKAMRTSGDVGARK